MELRRRPRQIRSDNNSTFVPNLPTEEDGLVNSPSSTCAANRPPPILWILGLTLVRVFCDDKPYQC